MVWWNDNLGHWCVDVCTEDGYVGTYICASLEEMGKAFSLFDNKFCAVSHEYGFTYIE